jgi:hypothetical protein
MLRSPLRAEQAENRKLLTVEEAVKGQKTSEKISILKVAVWQRARKMGAVWGMFESKGRGDSIDLWRLQGNTGGMTRDIG